MKEDNALEFWQRQKESWASTAECDRERLRHLQIYDSPDDTVLECMDHNPLQNAECAAIRAELKAFQWLIAQADDAIRRLDHHI